MYDSHIYRVGLTYWLAYWLLVSVSASHTVGREFASKLGHTKDHHKNGADRLPVSHVVR